MHSTAGSPVSPAKALSRSATPLPSIRRPTNGTIDRPSAQSRSRPVGRRGVQPLDPHAAVDDGRLTASEPLHELRRGLRDRDHPVGTAQEQAPEHQIVDPGGDTRSASAELHEVRAVLDVQQWPTDDARARQRERRAQEETGVADEQVVARRRG